MKEENLITYLDIPVDYVQGMTILDGINDWSDSFSCFFLIEKLFFQDRVEKLN